MAIAPHKKTLGEKIITRLVTFFLSLLLIVFMVIDAIILIPMALFYLATGYQGQMLWLSNKSANYFNTLKYVE